MDVEKEEKDQLMFCRLKPNDNALEETTTTSGSFLPTAPSEPNVCLEDGMPLPVKYRKQFPKHLFQIPINDIDAFYKNKKTFVVIGTNWEIHRFSTENSFGALDVFNCFRWLTIRITCHRFFRYFLVLTMLFFWLFFWIMFVAPHIQLIFLPILVVIFTFEFVVKIIAAGVIRHPFSYFRSPWNVLDAILILVFIIDAIFVYDHYHVLMIIASLRFLKLIQLFPGRRTSFAATFRNVIYIKDFIISYLFLFLVFTLYTLNAYGGGLRNRCWPNDLPIEYSLNDTEEVLYIIGPYLEDNNICGNSSGTRLCQENYTCLAIRNPNDGFTNFDNFGYAALGTLRLMTRDYWEALFYQVQHAFGSTSVLFFLTILILGNLLFNNIFASYIAVGVGQYFGKLLGKVPSTTPKQLSPERKNKSQQSTNQINQQTEEVDVNLENPRNDTSPVIAEVIITSPTVTSDENTNVVERWWKKFKNFVFGWTCCCSCFIRMQKRLSDFLLHRYFEYFINSIILLSLLIMAIYVHDIPHDLVNVFRYMLLGIDVLYVIEAVAKIFAFSLRGYFKDGWNILDFIIVLDILLVLFVDEKYSIGYTLFRAFRFLRYGKRWKRFSFIYRIDQISVFMMILVLWIFACVGYFLFYKFYYFMITSTLSRWNFLSVFEAFELVVRATAGEWIETMWSLLAINTSPWLVYPYYITLILMGYLLVTHTFLHLVMACLETNVLTETDHMLDQEHSLGFFQHITSCFTRNSSTNSSERNGINSANEANGNQRNELTEAQDGTLQDSISPMQTEVANIDSEPPPCCCDCLYRKSSFTRLTTSDRQNVLVNLWKTIRSKCYTLTTNPIWELFITAFIILSCIPYTLTLSDTHAMEMINIVVSIAVAIVFIFEIILRLIGEGFKTYFGNSWSRFDFIIIIIHLFLSLFSGINGFLILRLIPRLQCLRVVVETLTYRQSILFESIIVIFMLWTLFAIIGVGVFGEGARKCITDSYLQHTGTYNVHECLERNFTWVDAHVNFDHIGNAYVALLQMATFKGWVDIWHRAEDVVLNSFRGAGTHSFVGWFFLSFILFGSFLCFAIFVASLIIKINDQRKQIGGGYLELLLTVNQRKTLAKARRCWFMEPKRLLTPKESGFTRYLSRMVHNKIFDGFTILMLMANTVVLALHSYRPDTDHWTNDFFDWANSVLICGFIIEIVLRLLVYERDYFKKLWNIYDFVVISGSVINFVVFKILHVRVLPAHTWAILRVIRLVRWLKWVRRIILIIRVCTPALVNAGLFVFVVLLFFSVTAMQLFKHVRFEDTSFDSLWSTLMIMIEITLGGGWSGVYNAMAKDGHSAGGFILNLLIISYFNIITFGTIIFLENYYRLIEKLRLGITDDNLENFTKTWRIFDPDATGYLSQDDLSDFMDYLHPPFQLPKPNEELINDLDVPTSKENRVQFGDVLQTIIYHLDREKKTPKPTLTVEEEEADSKTRHSKIKDNVTALDQIKNFCCAVCINKKMPEENQGLTTDD